MSNPSATSTRLSAPELRATVSLAAIFALRMLGLFMIMPVFSIYAKTIPGGDNVLLVGIALGAYGVTQSLLYIFYGWISDKVGRKAGIATGLAVAVNYQHHDGMTLNGALGGDIFSQSAPQVVPFTGNTGSGTVAVSIANVGVRYILDRPAVAGVIVGARLGVAQHIADNARVFGFELDDADYAMIEPVLATDIAHWHDLDHHEVETLFAGPRDEIIELILVDSAQRHGVDLDREASGLSRSQPFEDRLEMAAAGDRRDFRAVERVD